MKIHHEPSFCSSSPRKRGSIFKKGVSKRYGDCREIYWSLDWAYVVLDLGFHAFHTMDPRFRGDDSKKGGDDGKKGGMTELGGDDSKKGG